MKIFGFLMVLSSLFACNKETVNTPALWIDSIPKTKYYETEIFTDGNLRLYGKWQFLYIYDDAGIIAGPGKINPNYDFLDVKKYGIYGKVKDNKLLETGQIKIVGQSASEFEIMLQPDEKNSVSNASWYYVTYTNDSIILRDATVGCGVLYNVYKRIN